MADEIATEVLREVDQEKGDRGTFETLWTQTARRVFPRGDNFQGRNITPGERRTEWQFDSKPVLALERWAAVMLGVTMPPSEFYHGWQAEERSIRKELEVKQWCEELRDDCFQMRYSTRSGFTGQINETWMSAGAFGTSGMFIDDRPGEPVTYKSMPLEKTWIREGAGGLINCFYRQLDLRPHQAIEMFGANRLPEQIMKSAQTEPKRQFAFYHRVKPRQMVNRNLRFSPESMEFQSDYVCELEKKHVETGGYRVFPAAFMRLTTISNEVYGRGPAQTVLADIKMKNEIWRTVLRSSHRMADPTVLLADDAALAPFQMQPGFRNKGYLKSSDGTELAKMMKWEGDLQPAMLVAAATDKDIDDAFLMTIFQLMLTNPNMTATEVLERIRERAMLLTPAAGRVFKEFVGAMAEREADILQARGKLSEVPEALAKYDGRVETTDESPLAKAQKASRAIGFERTLQQVLPLAESNPKVLNRFKSEEIIPELAEIHGMPLSWLYTNDEMEQINAAQAEQEATTQAADAAPGVASAAKDAAQARLYIQQAGGNI